MRESIKIEEEKAEYLGSSSTIKSSALLKPNSHAGKTDVDIILLDIILPLASLPFRIVLRCSTAIATSKVL